ncbi:DNA replication factor Dna2 [Musa troglodytarum]|uniref:DNA replication ATP-dependent helicase/nuclease n=1 Tax=Musa troglodytarum TaxID=320322 RepID=A0A9E7G0N8_9LILI|nr:DNA replication factor Dna2 [Musa troglodytarum]
MAPKKRASASSSSSSSASSRRTNQSQQPSQPSKFGIQHFFERHSQSQAAASSSSSNPPDPIPDRNLNPPQPGPAAADKPPRLDAPSEGGQSSSWQISPEAAKSVTNKRVRFSPGMSQDDGGDAVTWKISPVNERLQSISSKQLPRMMRISREAPRPQESTLRPCSLKQVPSCSNSKLEKWLSSSATMASVKSLSFSREVLFEESDDYGSHESNDDPKNATAVDFKSSFRTPPSMPYGSKEQLIGGVGCNEETEQLGSQVYRKALLDLLDQVEDAITDEPVPGDPRHFEGQNATAVKIQLESDPSKRSFEANPAEINSNSSPYDTFLVLEVSEKHKSTDSLCVQTPLKVLRLLNEQSGQERILHLCDEWFYSLIGPGDTISVVGDFDGMGRCIVDHAKNLIIVHPDILVSGTRVASSFTCSRRAVLDERLKSSEHSSAALLGTLLHQIFQAGLLNEFPSRQFLEEYAGMVLQKNIENIYACGANEKDIFLKLLEAIPRILNWLTCFKVKEEGKGMSVDFGHSDGTKDVSISEVIDIEEMAWAPRYGLKGMIDASVRVKVTSSSNGSHETIMPLEFKTGKGNNGQTDQTQNLTMCKACRHLNICMVYHKAYGGNSDSSGLGDLFDKLVGHLTVAHCKFLKHWVRLVDLEAQASQANKKAILRPRTRRGDNSTGSLSYTLVNLKSDFPGHESVHNGRHIYHFVRHGQIGQEQKFFSESRMNNLDCTFRCGDYVVLSTEAGRIAVASGVINDISQSHVSVSFSRRLRLPGIDRSLEMERLIQEVWRIDKDEFASSFAIMRFNLIQLFAQSSQCGHLRKMIVDLETPRFDSEGILSQDPAVSYIRSEKNLNDDQRRSIQKTSTMVHAVKALLIRGASILLTSYTNSAIDTLLIKLKSQGIDFVRVGRREAMHTDVLEHCFTEDIHTVDEIKAKMEHVRVVGVTCLGINHPLLVNKKFDICIMDEAGQTTLPVSLGPLMLASKFVLVGDHYQLPPLVQSTEARENGMCISLFCRLSEAHPQAISALQCQYRMCAGIMELSNALIYGNRLRCGSSEIADAKLEFSCSKSTILWQQEILNPNRSVIFVSTDNLAASEEQDHKALVSYSEAYIISEITKELIRRGIAGDGIGIITPYNSQANIIRQVIGASVEVQTIDKYQGRDKDCIMVSFVRSSKNLRSCNSSLLGDWHRINVAITRAKKKLIMVGSCETLSRVPLLKLLIEKVNEQDGIVCISNNDLPCLEELKKSFHPSL